jgi:hypothetical protein
MRYTKWLASLAMAAGVALTGTAAASAQEWRDGAADRYYDRQDLRGDYARVERMRADIARDRARLDEDIRCGRDRQAARDAADLARDQRALDAQLRDIHHDRRDLYRDYRYNWR